MECSWEFDDGTVCGKPADAMRTRFIPVTERWLYCPIHLAVVRRMTPDVDARVYWGIETYDHVAVIEDQERPLVWIDG